MVFNPAGFQAVYGDRYDIITGYARGVISGGQFVFSSGATGAVSSGVNSFNPATDLLFVALASGNQVNGIALNVAGSNEPVAVARRGTFLVTAAGNVNAGAAVAVEGTDAILAPGAFDHQVGRTLTNAGSGGYCLMDLDVA